MNTPPLVSVIVPSYNHAKFVEQAIISIETQTYKNIEVFVIDDGSTDNSVELLTELSKKYHFYFESQKNIGIIPTLNKLISKCKGKYIAPCASDDFWMLDKLEKQVAFMESNPDVGCCFGNILNINENNELLPTKNQLFLKQNFFSFNEIFTSDAYLPTPSSFWRRDVFEQIGVIDHRFYIEDLYLWLKITHAGYKMFRMNDLVAFYRQHSKNVHHNVLKMYQGTIQIFDLYKDHPLYEKAVKKRKLHFFPYLAVFYKTEAFKIFNTVFGFNFSFFAGLILLFIPSPISKGIIKYATKYFLKKYNYLN